MMIRKWVVMKKKQQQNSHRTVMNNLREMEKQKGKTVVIMVTQMAKMTADTGMHVP
jgi:energy-coupling factor transporter ATP-binding protein EcfA2